MTTPAAPPPSAPDEGLNVSLIQSNIFEKFKTAEEKMVEKITDMKDDPTMKEMVEMQMESQKWSMFGEMTTTLVKSLCDFSKKAIQQSS